MKNSENISYIVPDVSIDPKGNINWTCRNVKREKFYNNVENKDIKKLK